MIIFGDVHLGKGRKNKIYYEKFFTAFDYIINEINKTYPNSVYIGAGDIFDDRTPHPYEYMRAHQALQSCCDITLIPGNHDTCSVGSDTFPAETLTLDLSTNIKVCTKPTELTIGKLSILLLPYSFDMFDVIRNNTKQYDLLISHFSTFQSHAFAGTIDEDDPAFNNFKSIIIGDTHDNYDHNKFHTTCSTYFNNVDEMISKSCIPSVLYIDEHHSNPLSTLKRITFPELKPKMISSIEEVPEDADDTTLYTIVSDEPIISKNPNIFIKIKHKNDSAKNDETSTDNTMTEQIISFNNISSTSIHKIIDIVYSELSSVETNRLKQYIDGQIGTEQLYSEISETEKEQLHEESDMTISNIDIPSYTPQTNETTENNQTSQQTVNLTDIFSNSGILPKQENINTDTEKTTESLDFNIKSLNTSLKNLL